MSTEAYIGGMENEARHGGPYDRGAADSYYRRPFRPHYFVAGSYTSPKVTDLTAAEIEEYRLGFAANEANGDFKDYGGNYYGD